tara:strand:- start:554 stop:1243 length:690 start_codon:yes stop_codon:yes gene_type:complete
MALRKKNKTETQDMSDKDVVEYLVNNPNFINENVDLFNKLFSLNKSKGNLISFEDIRIKSLINENTFLKDKIQEILNNAKSNEVIQEKLQRFSNELISKRDVNELLNFIKIFISKEFLSFEIEIGLLNIKGFDKLDNKFTQFSPDLINEIFILKQPVLLNKKIIKKYSLVQYEDEKCSVVICPLGIDFPFGIIFINYNSPMIEKNHQFDLLASLSNTVSSALNQFIIKK